MNRVRLAFFLMLVCGFSVMAVAASPDAVRFTASPGVVQMRVEVLSPSGTALYDSDWKSGNLLDWIVADNLGHPLPYGTYRLLIRSKDLEGRTSEKVTTLHVAANRVIIDAAPDSDLKLTATLHDGETGQLVTTSGDLLFRFGDFLSRKDAERMRLTAAGNLGIGTDTPQARLDVNGLIRTSEGIAFPDGSIQRSAAMPTIVRMRPSTPEQEKKIHPKSDIVGSGTTNQMTKWLDGPGGMVGDSAVTEVSGKVGIGTTNPGGQLHIYGVGTNDIFAGMGPDVINGPGFNYGYAGGTFGVGAGFFNVRPAAGATGVNPSLRFMTVNLERMIVTNAGDVGIGTSAPAQKLDVNGNVKAATLTLSGNLELPATTATAGVIMLGGNRFAHNFGLFNTFLGVNAGNFAMSGDSNTASGVNALSSNTTGYYNTASGVYALSNNTTGFSNTASGFYALYSNTTGYYNTAVGHNALVSNNSGYYNTAIGHQALYNNTGVDNFGFGALAGYNLTTGNHNIDIANQGVAAEANTIRIGSGAQTRAFIGGIRGVTTGAADAVAVVIDSNGQLGTASSSRRYKFDIAGMGDATEGLMRLRPVSFRYLAHGDNAPLQYGLIAEEVAEVYPELVARNKDGEVETVMYQFLAPMLLNELQKEHRRNEEQQKTIEALNTALERRTAEFQSENAMLRTRLEVQDAALRDQLERLMRRVEQMELKRTAPQ